MKICVDTVVLIDVLKDEFKAYQDKLYAALIAKESLIAPAVVFAELMPQFKRTFPVWFLHRRIRPCQL